MRNVSRSRYNLHSVQTRTKVRQLCTHSTVKVFLLVSQRDKLRISVCVCAFGLFLQPKVVTDTDETELARQLERLERENAEVDGDDDAEEMEAKAED